MTGKTEMSSTTDLAAWLAAYKSSASSRRADRRSRKTRPALNRIQQTALSTPRPRRFVDWFGPRPPHINRVQWLVLSPTQMRVAIAEAEQAELAERAARRALRKLRQEDA